MTKHYALSAEARDRAGKGVARALRRENKIPAVIYGDAKDAESIALPVKEVTLEYHKGHMFTNLCDLEINGKKQLVLARDVQVHPVNDSVQHVDFMRVTAKTTIAVDVPVHFLNEENCPGIKLNKGSLTIDRHNMELICKATEIPEHIEIDLLPYDIGEPIKLSAAKLPQGVKSANKRDITVASIAAPRMLLEEEDAINAEKAALAAEAEAAAAAAAPAEGDAAAAKEGDKK